MENERQRIESEMSITLLLRDIQAKKSAFEDRMARLLEEVG